MFPLQEAICGANRQDFKRKDKRTSAKHIPQKEVTGLHYSLPGHSHWDLKVQVIEKVTPNTPSYRLEREEFWIKRLVTKFPHGLNKND
jgi:hypothetical protein